MSARALSGCVTVVGVMLAWSAVVGGAQRPDLTGTWVPVDARGAPGTPWLEQVEPPLEVITQTADAVTTTRRWGVKAETAVHRPDDVEREEPTPRPGRVRARWDGDRLVTRRTETPSLPRGTATVTTRETRWLDADGHLVVEAAWTTETGATLTRLKTYPACACKYRLATRTFGHAFTPYIRGR